MKERIENLELEILTPIYIGGNENSKLKKLSYVYDSQNKKINIISEEKLVREMVEIRKYDEFISQIKKAQKDTGIKQIIDNMRLDINKLDIYEKTLDIAEVQIERGKETLNEILMFVKDGNNDKYIPGSTIKGYIINAIKSYYIENKTFLKFQRYINNNDEKMKKENDKTIAKEINNTFNNKKNIDGQELEEKIGQAISIPDVYIDNNCTYIAMKEDLTIKKTKSGLNKDVIIKLPIYREYIMPGQKFQFTMKVNYDILKRYGIGSIDDILNCLQAKVNNVKSIDECTLSKTDIVDPKYSYNNVQPNCVLGAGAGYYYKGLMSAIIKDKNKLKNDTVKRLNKKHNHEKQDVYMSPRTVKLVKYDEQYYVVGMCNLRKV